MQNPDHANLDEDVYVHKSALPCSLWVWPMSVLWMQKNKK